MRPAITVLLLAMTAWLAYVLLWRRLPIPYVDSPAIIKETVTPGRWMAMYLGLFGTYRKNETVDVEYQLRGETKLAADVEILPDP